jgi:hypothetical protein
MDKWLIKLGFSPKDKSAQKADAKPKDFAPPIMIRKKTTEDKSSV